MSQDKRAAWETYASAWKLRTAEQKRAALKASVIADCVYTDPNIVTHGYDQLIDYMIAFHQQVPGGSFDTVYYLAHHDVSIARWNMLNGEGAIIGDGISYAKYNETGTLLAMTGFFETPAS